MPYDAKCRELAKHFLPTSGSERLVGALSQHIQVAIETWLSEQRDRMAADAEAPPAVQALPLEHTTAGNEDFSPEASSDPPR